jgi:hypothetical protein
VVRSAEEWTALVEQVIAPWIKIGRQYEEEDKRMASEDETDTETATY